MAISRRQFLKRSGVVAAGSLLGPGLWGNPFVRQAMAAIGDRYFVVLFLDGGNDGLNTVVPVSGALRAAYEAARKTGNGGLRLRAADLAGTTIGADPGTGAPLALHPGLIGLKNLYDLGKVAVIQGCGYPEYSLSHEESRGIWETGNPLGLGAYAGTGWMGRFLASGYGSLDIPGVTLADAVAREYRQTATSVLALNRLADFGFPYDDFAPSDTAAKRAAFASLCGTAGSNAQPNVAYIGDSATATLVSSESYPPLHQIYRDDRASFDAQYGALDTGTARRLREVAKIIYGVATGQPNVSARFFQLSNGGYDTHSDQGAGESDGQQYLLHREVGDALEVFYQDCADMGVASKVSVLVWSEFSRRIEQNDNGTDHGSQGPMLVIGGSVTGGVYGNHPDIAASALDDDGNTAYSQAAADPHRSTDFRDVYGTVLKHWLNMDEATILSTVLPPDAGTPADYWTDPDFDLGFL